MLLNRKGGHSIVDVGVHHGILPPRGGMTGQSAVSTGGSRLLVTPNDREGDRLLLAA